MESAGQADASRPHRLAAATDRLGLPPPLSAMQIRCVNLAKDDLQALAVVRTLVESMALIFVTQVLIQFGKACGFRSDRRSMVLRLPTAA